VAALVIFAFAGEHDHERQRGGANREHRQDGEDQHNRALRHRSPREQHDWNRDSDQADQQRRDLGETRW